MISHRTTFSVFSEASDDIINDCIKNVKVLFCDDTLNFCVIGIFQQTGRRLKTIFESRTASGADTDERSEPRFSEEKQKSRGCSREDSDNSKSQTCDTSVRNIVGSLAWSASQSSVFAHSNLSLFPPPAALRDSPHRRREGVSQLTAAARGFCSHAAANAFTACGTTKIIGHPKGDRLFL